MSRFELFTHFDLFQGLSVDDLFSLLTKVSLDFENFQAGETLFTEGEPTKGLVFLLNGKVQKIQQGKTSFSDGPAMLVFTHIFGTQTQIPATAKAIDACSLLVIEPKSMLYMLRSNEVVLKNYLDMISDTIA